VVADELLAAAAVEVLSAVVEVVGVERGVGAMAVLGWTVATVVGEAVATATAMSSRLASADCVRA
jgi:hypothetical protein